MFFIQDHDVKAITCDLATTGHGVLNTTTMACSTPPTTPRPRNRGNNSHQEISFVLFITSVFVFLNHL